MGSTEDFIKAVMLPQGTYLPPGQSEWQYKKSGQQMQDTILVDDINAIEEDNVSLIGEVLELGGDYLKYKYGYPAAFPQPATGYPSNPWMGVQQGGQLPPLAGTTLPVDTMGLPFDVIGRGPTSGCDRYVFDPRANCGQGKWIRRSKRRRKRLASASDIRDIGALKTVLTGAQLTSWIAVHG